MPAAPTTRSAVENAAAERNDVVHHGKDGRIESDAEGQFDDFREYVGRQDTPGTWARGNKVSAAIKRSELPARLKRT